MTKRTMLDYQVDKIELEVRVDDLRNKINTIRNRQGDITIRNQKIKERIGELLYKLSTLEDSFEIKEEPLKPVVYTYITLEEKTMYRHQDLDQRINDIRDNIEKLKKKKAEITNRTKSLIEKSYACLNRNKNV